MIINHNMMAMNTNRQLGINGDNTQKSIEKLSSGLRINRAGDDAAGLSISEKMRGQIRGLDQASRNAEDGISLIQTAEGALNETEAILQRMKELSTQAANDTNTTGDRKEIQKEMNQLTSEISRIGNTTEFNTQKLLKGKEATGEVGSFKVNTASDVGTAAGAATVAEGTASVAKGTGAAGIVEGTASTAAVNSTATVTAGVGDTLTVTNPTGTAVDITIEQAGDDNLAVSGTGGNLTISLADSTKTKNTAALIESAVQSLGTVDGTDFSKWTFAAAGNWDTATDGATLTTDNDTLAGGTEEALGSNTLTLSAPLVAGDSITVGGVTVNAGAGLAINTDSATTVADQAAALKTALEADASFGAGAHYEITDNADGTLTIAEGAGKADGSTLSASVANLAETVGVSTFTIDTAFEAGDTVTFDGNDYVFGTDFSGADADAQATSLAAAIGGETHFDALTTTATANVITVTEAAGEASGTLPTSSVSGAGARPGVYEVTLSTNMEAGETITMGSQTLTAVEVGGTAGANEFVLGANTDTTATAIAAAVAGDYTATATGSVITITEGTASGTDLASDDISVGATGGNGFNATLQIGASQGQSFEVSIRDMRSSALGIAGTAEGTATGADASDTVTGASFAAIANTDALTDVSKAGTAEYALDVTTNEKASAAIKVIDQAIAEVSAERSKLGASQNRLEHTIKNLDTSSENLTAAESRIRDVDMAKEMMAFTKNNILQQAAQSMLAQANQQPQGVLQLLR